MQTINDFFNLDNEAANLVSRVAKSQEFARIRQHMVQKMKGFPLSTSFDGMVIRQFKDLFDIRMSDILLWTWCKHREIIQYRDTGKYPPGKIYTVPLLEHTITSKHSPAIQPVINNQPLPFKIKFDVVLRLKMKGAMLKIVNAKITEILVGSCAGNGTIEYEGFTVAKKETAPFDFPGSITFKEGVHI